MSILPGLPPLAPGVSVFADATLLVSDAILAALGLPAPWGIYDGGTPVIVADNVASFEYAQDWRISKYPVEEGAFASYNKVANPFTVRVRFSTGGTLFERQAMLASVEAIAGDTELYDVVTPEKVYVDCNVVHVDYDRKAMNAGLLVMDVWLEEVRVAGASEFTSTKNPTDQKTTQGGIVQGVERGPDLPDLTPSNRTWW